LATHRPVVVDELFGELVLSSQSEKWQVIHTKPQCEKKLAGYLKKNNINYYLPLWDSFRRYKYRKVAFTKPMFPGYLFARLETQTKPAVLISGYAVSFLKVPDEKELLDDLVQIHTGRMLKAEMQEGVWMEKGWQVEIISGPMQGVKGIVQSQSRLDEVNLQVNILRQAIMVKVLSSDVRIIREYHNQYNSSE
jgi:transcriptional antiterminator RfaH